MPLCLKVHAVPPGEAPLWVREQWVGLALPVARSKTSPRLFLTSGVLSGPRTFRSRLFALVTGRLKPESGYAVDTRAAMAVLATASPEAFAWWEKNVPHVMQPGRYLVFEAGVGHVEEFASGPLR